MWTFKKFNCIYFKLENFLEKELLIELGWKNSIGRIECKNCKINKRR
jgi:hypothetical protein